MKKETGILLTVLGIVATLVGFATKIIGILEAAKYPESVTIIGGADGPTAIFLAGSISATSSGKLIIAGVVLIIMGLSIIRKK